MTSASKWIWLLVGPALAFLLVAFMLPVALLIGSSFYHETGLSASSYVDFASDSASQRAYWRTVRIAGLVTLLAVALCYPAAYAISRVGAKWRPLLIAIVVLPLMTNSVARTFSWLVIFGRQGLINSVAGVFGVEPLRILYTEGAVVVGLLHLFVPLMMLPLISAFENVPRDVVLAARSLGSSELQVFGRILVPLTAEGLAIGGTLVFTGCVTAYVTPAVLGGSRNLMLSTLLYQEASVTLDWAGATVVAMVMLLTTLLAIFLIRKLSRVSRSRPVGR